MEIKLRVLCNQVWTPPGYSDLAKGIKLSQLFILTLPSYLKFQVLSLRGYTYAVYFEFLDSNKAIEFCP